MRKVFIIGVFMVLLTGCSPLIAKSSSSSSWGSYEEKEYENDVLSYESSESFENFENSSESEDDEYLINGDVFYYQSYVSNDHTNNWRLSVTDTDQESYEYALNYYNDVFESDDEVHAVINYNAGTTTRISILYSGTLDVSVLSYVQGEELDASTLFSGSLLEEYFIDIETGEVEDILNEEYDE